MSIRLLVDMNLSPEWIAEFARHEYDSIHWSSVGDPQLDDASIMAWARKNQYVVFTHDLDFGTILALTHAAGPSVVQVRGPDALPESISRFVVAALRQHEEALGAGAIVVADRRKARVRILPL
jgi:predicted nuclease of predicted toxin-antitoxin system